MRSYRHDGPTGTAAALVTVLQLLVLVVLPLAHAGTAARSLAAHAAHVQEAGSADHTESPLPGGGGHDESACHLCRVVDGRYIGAVTAARASRSVATWVPGIPISHSRVGGAASHFPQGPRPPPIG